MSENQKIIDNHPLVISIARTFPERDREDYIQVGRIGLLKAIRGFDPDRKTKFSTYATWCIRNEMIREYNKNKKHSEIINYTTFDHIPAPDKIKINTEDLDGTEKMVVDMKLCGYSYTDIANRLGCSRSKIRHILKSIGNKI